MPFAKKENFQLFYEIQGQGPPLVFINGFTNHLGIWDPFVSTFENHFQILRFDNRDSGRSETSSSPYSIDQMADDLIFLLDTLSINEANMVGFAMGGVIMQSIALRHPNRLKNAVIISPFHRFPTTAYLQAINSAKLRKAGVDLKLLIETVLPWIYSSYFLKDQRNIKQLIENFENNPYPQSPEGYNRQLEALYQYDQSDKLDQITHQTLLIAGQKDLYTPLYATQVLKDRLKNATLEIIPHAGHMAHIECKKKIINLIIPWLL